MNVHVYIGVENLALPSGQRDTLIAALQALGVANSSRQPAERNHWRLRTDGDAAIFEALFNEDNISIAAVKGYLASIFAVDVSQVSHATQSPSYGLLVTYTYTATDRLRLIAFGYDGGWPAWNASRSAVLDYLAANAAAWGEA